MKVTVYSETGKKKEAVALPIDLKDGGNIHLLAQAVRVYENNQHPGLAKVKSRSEVKGSTRKIYRQKGTGGARHGARTAPLFVGGGIAHGPTGHTRTLSMPRKMRQKALQVALYSKAREGKLFLVEGLSKLEKTKDAQKMLDAIVKEEKLGKTARVTVALADKNNASSRFLRNIKTAILVPYKQLNAYSVFTGGTMVLDSEALNESKEQGANNKEKEKVEVKKSPVDATRKSTVKKGNIKTKAEAKRTRKK